MTEMGLLYRTPRQHPSHFKLLTKVMSKGGINADLTSFSADGENATN